MAKSYYPDSNDDRADWWQNIITEGPAVFTELALTTDQTDAIVQDAAWGLYLYRTLRVAFEEATTRVIGYAKSITHGENGMHSPAAPAMPGWPTIPNPSVAQGIEARREMWVQAIKSNPNYDAGTMGTTLRLEAAGTPFNQNAYTSTLGDLSCPGAKQLRFKFGKAYGKIDGVNLYGRKTGNGGWQNLGRFNATPGNVMIPLADGSPEQWEFQSRGVKRDVEIGLPSPVMGMIIPS